MKIMFHVFYIFGLFAVAVFPLGIPFVTLYILLKNNDDIRSGGPARQRYEFLVADYRNEFHYWDTLEMTRKAFLTGILMFLKKGSLFQLAIAMVVCAGYLSASAWYQPYRTRSINIFKVGTELALLFTLMLIMLLKVDLEQEDIPGGETTVGMLLLITNVLLPMVALVLGLAFPVGDDVALIPVDGDAGGKDDEVVVEEESNPVAVVGEQRPS